MSTLLYSPGVSIFISTLREGIVDVTEDIASGSLSLRKNQSHSLTFSLVNHRRKYDGLFTPNDRIVCRMKRLRWMQVFAGYLTQVPFFNVYPTSVELIAECTLKRLRNKLWDPGAEDTVNLLNSVSIPTTLEGHALDDAFKKKATTVLVDIAEWEHPTDPTDTGSKVGIHIGAIPEDWMAKIDRLYQEVAPQLAIAGDLLGSWPTVGGQSIADQFGLQTIAKADGTPDEGPGYGHLPYTTAKVMRWYDDGTAIYTGENRSSPKDEWGCAIHAPWLEQAVFSSMTPQERDTARAWWANRRLLIVNPKNNVSVVLRVYDDGPTASTGRDIGITGWAMGFLAAVDGDSLQVRFAHPDTEPGSSGLQGQGTEATNLFHRPVPGAITGHFGDSRPGHSHGGIDMAAAMGETVTAAATGTVAFISNDGLCGNGLGIDHGGGTQTRYCHFKDPPLVGVGDHVNSAQAIGAAGMTGSATGPHLHFEIVVNGTRIDPEPFFSANPPPIPGGGTGGGGAGDNGSVPINTNEWFHQYDFESSILFGIRALMNDEPILPFIEMLMQTSMRHFCSGPDGSFIGWFPDYFGIYGMAGRMMVENIEIIDLSMVWSDERLKTHIFTAGSMTGFGTPFMSEEIAIRKATTQGIATVEFPAIMKALINADENNPDAAGWLDSRAILNRFGARQHYEGMGILTSPKAEFWYALALFQQNWADQFSAQVSITFMPELYPGMLMVLPGYGIQFYVNGVDHQWSFNAGGTGFTTRVYVSAPSAVDGSGLFGLPRGGRI